MKKSELKQIIKEEYNKILNEGLPPLEGDDLIRAEAYFEPIVKKHGGKILKYFKSAGRFAADVECYKVIKGNLVVGYCFSKSDAANLAGSFSKYEIDGIMNRSEVARIIKDNSYYIYVEK